MEQLAESQGLQHPATEPPGPLAVLPILDAPNHAVLLAHIPAKLQGSEQGVDGDADTHLLGRIDAKGKTRERGTNGRRKWRCQSCRRPWVAQPERLCLRIQEMGAEPGEEAEEHPVEKQDAGQ